MLGFIKFKNIYSLADVYDFSQKFATFIYDTNHTN